MKAPPTFSGIAQLGPSEWRVFHKGQYCTHKFTSRRAACRHLAMLDIDQAHEFASDPAAAPSAAEAAALSTPRQVVDCYEAELAKLADLARSRREFSAYLQALTVAMARYIGMLPAESAGAVIASMLNIANTWRKVFSPEQDGGTDAAARQE